MTTSAYKNISEVSNITLDYIVKNVSDQGLSSLNYVIRKVKKVIDENGDRRDLVDVIEKDLGLVTKFVALANSPLYRGSQELVEENNISKCVDRVIQRAGWPEVFSISMSVALRGFLANGDDDRNSYATNQLNRSIGIAKLSEKINDYFLENELITENYKDIYTYALLSDIGVLAGYQVLENYSHTRLDLLVASQNKPFIDSEKDLFGFSHQELGSKLLAKSGIPISICSVVEFHHEPEKLNSSFQKKEREIAHIIKLSDIMYQESRQESTHEIFLQDLNGKERGIREVLPKTCLEIFESEFNLDKQKYVELREYVAKSNLIEKLPNYFLKI